MKLRDYAQQRIAAELPMAQRLANDVAIIIQKQHKTQLCEFIAFKLLAQTYRATLPSYLKNCRIGSTTNEDPVPDYELLVTMIDMELNSIVNKMNMIAQARLNKVKELVGEDNFNNYIKTHSPKEIDELLKSRGGDK